MGDQLEVLQINLVLRNFMKSKRLTKGKEAQQRILLLMSYDSKKTLDENVNIILEQGIESRIGKPENPWILNARKEYEDEQQEAEYELRWRTGCGPNGEYYDNVIKPPKTPAGNEGILQCCCYYPTPASGFENKGEVRGMYIPRTSKLEFFDPKILSDLVDGWYEMFVKEGYNIKKDWLLRTVSEVFPMGTVSKITSYDGTVYETWISHSKKENGGVFDKFYFKGFYTKDGKPFEQEPVKDDRNLAQEFIDDWGAVIQWVTVIITAISGFFTGGSTLPLAAELALEFGIGLAVGIREIQKGNDISGAFTIAMGLLPALKFSPAFRGINPEHLDEISLAFQKSGLTTASHPSEFVAFYNRLSGPQKKTFDRIFRGGDGTSRRIIQRQLSKEAQERLPQLLADDFMKMWRARPKLMKDIPIFKRLWVRELGSGVTTAMASLLTQYVCPNCSKATSDKISEEYRDKLDGIYEYVRPEIRQEIGYFLLSNPEQSLEYLNSAEFTQAQALSKNGIGNYENNVSEGIINAWGSTMKKVAEEKGLDWQPTSDIFESQNKKMSTIELQKLISEGWIKLEDVPLGEEYSKIDLINGEYYVLPNIKKNIPIKDTIK